MFERIAECRPEPGAQLLEIGQLPARPDQWPESPARSQNGAVFPLLLQRFRVPVVHFLFRMLQDQEVAEEIAAEVFLRLSRSNGARSSVECATQLFRIATDLALGVKGNGLTQPPPDELADVIRTIRHAVMSMPGKQRAAVLLHKYHQMDCRHIAKVLNCSEPAAKSLLLSAYDLLRLQLAPYEANETWDYPVGAAEA